MFFKFKKTKETQESTAQHVKRRSFQHQPEIASIMVEDEERVRRFWKEFFRERGMKLFLYDSEKSFLEVHSIICFPVQFYFDQDFYQERGVGVRLANLVKNSPYRVSTHLITAYSPSDFSEELQNGVLDSVLPKYPVGLFGSNFFRTKMKKECNERGAEVVVAECAGRILQAIDPLLN